MKRAIIVCLLAVLGGLLTFPVARGAGIAVGTVDSSYVYEGSGYWKNQHTGDYYTRTRRDWSEPLYAYGYCYGSQAFYQYTYTAAYKPVSSLTPQSTDAEWIDLLKNRETIQGKIIAGKASNDAFLAKLAAIGVTPPFPELPGHSGAVYNSGYGKLAVVQGNTLYGYAPYTYSQVAEVRNSSALDRLVLHQLIGVNVNGLRGMVGDAIAQQGGLIGQEVELAKIESEGNSRRAEIEAQGRIDLEKLRILQPPTRITTNITGVTKVPVQPDPGPMGKVEEGGFRALAKGDYLKTACLQCHTGGKAEGKLDLTKPLTQAQTLAVLHRVTTADPAKRMPRTAEGAPGPQATLAQIRSLTD